MSEISQRAGVSVATASRVLNGSTHVVSPATRERVLAAARDMNYSPSALARALVARKSRIIGVIVGDIIDPYFAEIARGVEDVVGSRGYLTMVCSADRKTLAELAHVNALRDYHAAGVVFASSGFADDADATKLAEAVAELRENGTAVVAVAPREFDCIDAAADNRAAAREITDHLISLGHRRIAYVDGPAGLFTSQQRYEGFAAAMKAAGLDASLRFDGEFDYESGQRAANALLAGAGAALPDAVLASNDEVAIGVLTTLRQAGVDVPGQVSVAGIDDTRPAHFVELTTVRLPLYDLGAHAARSILAEHGEEEHPPKGGLTHSLIVRRTTARRA